MKTWTYEEITKETQDRIRSLLDPPHGGSELQRKWAFGAYLAWSWITRRHQQDGDAEAMERLANGENDAS